MNLPLPSFSVRYSATSFPAEIPKRGWLRFDESDLAHSLFVTGRAPGDENRYGLASAHEWVHRTSIVPAYVRMVSGRLTRSSLALDLDRSEKVGLSYALGQAMTAILCEKLLGVTRLMHIDRYAQRYGVKFDATRKRADLFGQMAGGWVVAEAKGRSNAMEAALKSQLIAQKRSVSTIAGESPAIALGCVASFPPATGVMRVDAFDPEKTEPEAIDLTISRDRFVLAYYEPFMAAISLGEPANIEADGTLLAASFPQSGLQVGLPRELVARLRQPQPEVERGLSDDVDRLLAGREDDRRGIFPDGSYVVADWAEALALNDTDF